MNNIKKLALASAISSILSMPTMVFALDEMEEGEMSKVTGRDGIQLEQSSKTQIDSITYANATTGGSVSTGTVTIGTPDMMGTTATTGTSSTATWGLNLYGAFTDGTSGTANTVDASVTSFGDNTTGTFYGYAATGLDDGTDPTTLSGNIYYFKDDDATAGVDSGDLAYDKHGNPIYVGATGSVDAGKLVSYSESIDSDLAGAPNTTGARLTNSQATKANVETVEGATLAQGFGDIQYDKTLTGSGDYDNTEAVDTTTKMFVDKDGNVIVESVDATNTVYLEGITAGTGSSGNILIEQTSNGTTTTLSTVTSVVDGAGDTVTTDGINISSEAKSYTELAYINTKTNGVVTGKVLMGDIAVSGDGGGCTSGTDCVFDFDNTDYAKRDLTFGKSDLANTTAVPSDTTIYVDKNDKISILSGASTTDLAFTLSAGPTRGASLGTFFVDGMNSGGTEVKISGISGQ